MSKELILILGGARSGKSDFAARLASERGGPVLFVATATAGDAEMAARIAAHRAARPATWHTLEAPVTVAAQLADAPPAATLLLDCLTLLVANLLLADEVADDATATRRIDDEIEQLLQRYDAGTATWLIVSNEVGLGLVPPYPLGRRYRDLLGRANQRLAARADRVYFLVAGLPLDLKALVGRLA